MNNATPRVMTKKKDFSGSNPALAMALLGGANRAAAAAGVLRPNGRPINPALAANNAVSWQFLTFKSNMILINPTRK